MVRLGRWAGVQDRPNRETSISITLLLSGRGGDEKLLEKDSSDSERLRLRYMARDCKVGDEERLQGPVRSRGCRKCLEKYNNSWIGYELQ